MTLWQVRRTSFPYRVKYVNIAYHVADDCPVNSNVHECMGYTVMACGTAENSVRLIDVPTQPGAEYRVLVQGTDEYKYGFYSVDFGKFSLFF